MGKKRLAVLITLAALVLSGAWLATADAQSKPAPAKKAKQADVKVDTCYGCHYPIKQLHTMGKHSKNNCVNCHSGDFKKHAENPGPDNRPVTDTSWEACGACHKEQFESFMKVAMHRPARDEKSQLTNRSPNPFWDKLMPVWDEYVAFRRARDAADAHLTMHASHYANLDPEEARFLTPEIIRNFCIVGEPDDLIEQLRRLEREGLKQITFHPPFERRFEVMERFARVFLAAWPWISASPTRRSMPPVRDSRPS